MVASRVRVWEVDENGMIVSCVGLGLVAVPRPHQQHATNSAHDPTPTTTLDLSNNNLTSLPDLAFRFFPNTTHLRVSGNRLTNVESKAFHRLPLQRLTLDNNQLSMLHPGSLPGTLLELSLEDNYFPVVPASALASLSQLHFLNLDRNKITSLREGDLLGLHSLTSLSLHQNQIKEVEETALQPLQHLLVLDLTENDLVELPRAVLTCHRLTRLLLGHNHLTYIGEGALSGMTQLQQVELQGNPLLSVHNLAFSHLPALTKLILKETRELTEFPNLNGTGSLEMLRIDRASLSSVPPGLCLSTPKLRSLNLHLNSITEIPDLQGCSNLKLLDLSDNAITSLGHGRFTGVPGLHDLLLQNNRIPKVPGDAFLGLTNLQVLQLQENEIREIEEDAFLPLVSLEDINLGDNQFPVLPQRGLKQVVSIKAHNNPYLRVFPGPDSFPNVHTLVLSYAYHCCPFHSLDQQEETSESGEDDPPRIKEDVLFDVSQYKDFHPDLWGFGFNKTSLSEEEEAPANHNNTTSSSSTTIASSASSSSSSGDVYQPQPPLAIPSTGQLHSMPSLRVKPHCIPLPGPFMPCRDLFDWWTLRCGAWIVFLLALMGNGVVVVVLVAAYTKMDVPRFLVTNLALADFFMGVYLGFLAVVDASTLGEFRMYAIPWQMSAGCQVAGFLGVLSSELSVYTLAVITLERNYAITHAMHLQKRLSLRQAAYIMVAGWLFAITMAVLPLAGVSDYRKFAVCLPFETDGAGLGYVVFLMFINGVAFLILMGCYFKIYCAIRGSQAWNSNDSRIAKRMALLVFTDFICWAPIAFFSLTAAFDIHLISLQEAKVFTVFILPLNSCCNPFLYALLTKQFKKDCVMLCKTIEESRVTRGIGRCRHSSNFSNRQTPANTNSAVDHSSQSDKQACSCKTKHEKKRPRWTLTSLKYLLCTRGAEEITSSSDTSYQTDPTQRRRGPRNTSLSSDTYSGSWSDTWRRGRGSTTLRLMDRRRHNSWAASHKPSQESSLSASRPDSAASASTATWRISRSSVSSDTSNCSSRTRGSDTPVPNRLGSLRRPEGRGFGPVRQHSQSQLVRESAARPLPNIRTKPRLMRQTAVEREAYTPGKESPPCPLHLRPDHLSCVYEQSHEDDALHPSLLLHPATLDTPGDDNVFDDDPPAVLHPAPPSPPTPTSTQHQRTSPSLRQPSPSGSPSFHQPSPSPSLRQLSPSPSLRQPSPSPSVHRQRTPSPSQPHRLSLVPSPSPSQTQIPPSEATALMEGEAKESEGAVAVVVVEDEQTVRVLETHFPVEAEQQERRPLI
ncbi:hypothetical protein Pmani_030906 [Petrolisthes manimaculis]|uniref:G-protein coupled receptors family 1 profile domain-containing protein n=1 Tax=Petrolisthes manimaculis TaxID=1843537 RepID=A0AAE1NUY8_9EUCA|nr:hypothetical protein Pmani_030906 [Petrolisthes manimaculis]